MYVLEHCVTVTRLHAKTVIGWVPEFNQIRWGGDVRDGGVLWSD